LATAALLRGLLSDPCPALDRASARYGPTFAVRVGPMRMVVVGDPGQLGQLLTMPNDSFRWGHMLNTLGFFVGKGSMIVSDGDDHRRRRGHVQPSFARRHLDGWVPMILAETDRMIDGLIDGMIDGAIPRMGTLDLFPRERKLVMAIVLNVLFGSGLNERVDEIEALMEPAKVYLEQSFARQLPHPLPFSRRSRARHARRALDRLIDEEMSRRGATAVTESPDLLDRLLAETGDDRLSDDEIRDQAVTLIGAGYDTTTSSMAWTTLCAAADPDVWARLRAEAETVFTDEPSPHTVHALTYAQAVVKEALRLHPAGVFSPRQAVRDVRIGEHIIRKGTFILWSPYLAGRDANTWDDPLTFRPERHLDPDPATAALTNNGWVPFGRGPRKCIGFALAQMELTLAIARLAQRVDLTLESPTMPRPYGMVVNRPTGGVRAKVSVLVN
jgi:cytochrome P450